MCSRNLILYNFRDSIFIDKMFFAFSLPGKKMVIWPNTYNFITIKFWNGSSRAAGAEFSCMKSESYYFDIFVNTTVYSLLDLKL